MFPRSRPWTPRAKWTCQRQILTANDMDCLQCHQSKYFATFMPTATSNHVSCVDGSTHTYQTPVPEADGKIHKADASGSLRRAKPRSPWPGPCAAGQCPSCVTKCHAKAGGSDGAKRGDIASAMVNPTTAVDVHLSSAGTAKLNCTSCHASTDARANQTIRSPAAAMT